MYGSGFCAPSRLSPSKGGPCCCTDMVNVCVGDVVRNVKAAIVEAPSPLDAVVLEAGSHL